MSALANRQSIVVGVDGSDTAENAALWAAAVADRQSVPVHLLHALPNPGYYYSEAAALLRAEYTEMVEKSAKTILGQTADRIHSAYPNVAVTDSVDQGSAGPALVALSVHAKMLVVGATGASVLEYLVTGSTALRVANDAHCAVTVWRGDSEHVTPDHRPVVVGVDGSELSGRAIGEAFEFASLFEVPLIAVHAWNAGGIAGRHSAMKMVGAVVEQEEALASECLAGWTERYPDVGVTTVVEQENPARSLLHHAAGAQLVVVGSRGRNRLTGTLLGSTSQNLVHHASCPTMICRDTE